MIEVRSVKVTPKSATIAIGQRIFLNAEVFPKDASNDFVRWEANDSRVVAVDLASGQVRGLSAGTTYVFATSTDCTEKYDHCVVTVTNQVWIDTITLSPSLLRLKKGDKKKIGVSFCPKNASNKNLKWVSSNKSIASVDKNGLVTAKNVGSALITAMAQDGSNVFASVSVEITKSNKPNKEQPKNTANGSKVADPIDALTGAHLIENSVISLYGGQNLNLLLKYNSLKLASGEFGCGWHHNFEKHLELVCDDEGCGPEQVVDNGIYPKIRLYDSPSTFREFDISETKMEYFCNSPDKADHILSRTAFLEYPYLVQCAKDKLEYYNQQLKLAKIVDHQGFVTLISYNDNLTTIEDTTTGKKIYLEKNANGKVTKVYDDSSREAVFSYTGNNLTTITDLNGNSLNYTYTEDGQVLTGTDSKNIKFFENTYDRFGRVISQTDAVTGSLPTIFCYDDLQSKRTITNRNGKKSTRIFNSEGLLGANIDENGNITTYLYDDRFNIISQKDANGFEAAQTYGMYNKLLQTVDKNGNKTTAEYDTKGNLIKITHPEINGVHPVETFTYNNRNQVIEHTDVKGTVTVYTYDANGFPASKKTGDKNAQIFNYQNGLLMSETDSLGNITSYTYNAVGLMASKTDSNNKTTSYEYDACGNLTKITDPNAHTVVMAYDGNNQKISETDQNGNVTRYAYNGNLKNISVTLPDNNVISYSYDGEDRQTKITDQAGNITTMQYDDAGRLVLKSFPDGSLEKYVYDAAGNVLKTINKRNAAVTKTYDGNGNVLTETDSEGNIKRYQYNSLSKIVREVNPVSGTTLYQYSPAGELLSVTDPLGNKTVYTYDAFGNKLSCTDPNGNQTLYTYDQNNNLLTVCDALGNVTTYTYDSLNRKISEKDANNNVITYGYDALGRCTTVTDALNNVFTTVYDANGNVLKVIDAKNNVVSETTYNCLNLPATATDASGNTLTYTYNSLGKVATVKDAMQNVTEYTYNSRGVNTSVKDALNGISRADYNNLGLISSVFGPLNGSTSFIYDDMGRLTIQSTASNGGMNYTYNELNLKKQLTNARGQKRKFFYDAAGRITGFVGAEDSASYSYDKNGNVLTVTDSFGTVTRKYDELNRVKKYTDTFGNSIHYQYDAVGNLSKLIYPDGTSVRYTYNANNNLLTVTDWANRITSYSYDQNGNVIGISRPNGTYVTNVYDAKQRIISSVDTTALGTVITGFEYTYDSLGRIICKKILDKNKKICYTYDNLSRVTQKVVKDLSDNVISQEDFSYDAAGNIKTSPNSVYVYDINNRLLSYNGHCVSYDAEGNMLSSYLGEGVKHFSYDSANRVLKAGALEYTYNAEDVRTSCTNGENITTFLYNTNCKLSQLLQKTTNGVVTKYVYGNELIGEETNGFYKLYHFDYRGSTVATTNVCGSIIDTFEYGTYGNLLSRTGSDEVIFGYNGRDGVVTDGNGLIYMRARYYSPELKRFINADVVTGEISNAITLNRYAYANGNPVSNIDPFGLSAERGKETIKNIYSISQEKYRQITNSKLSSSFAPNQEGYGNITTTDTSFIQLFTTQKYEKGNIFYHEGWRSITYVYVTLPVSEWRKQITTYDLYDENIAQIANLVFNAGVSYFFDANGIPSGDAVSELYGKIDNWASENLSNLVLDESDRYISNAISGKKNNEKVSLLLGAYRWDHTKNPFTGKWSTSYIGYGYAWSNKINFYY